MLKRIREYIKERKEMRLRWKCMKIALSKDTNGYSLHLQIENMYNWMKGLPPKTKLDPTRCDKALYRKCLKLIARYGYRYNFSTYDFNRLYNLLEGLPEETKNYPEDCGKG